MEVFMTEAGILYERLTGFILSLKLWDLLDILVIAYLIYRLLLLVRKTNSSRLLKGVLVVIIALWLSAGRLRALNFLLNYIVEWGVVALLVLFPELWLAIPATFFPGLF